MMSSFLFLFVSSSFSIKRKKRLRSNTGFPQHLKNHWNSDLFQDHGKIIELQEKFLKFVKMRKSWKNHGILDQLLMEKSFNFDIDIVLTNYIMCK